MRGKLLLALLVLVLALPALFAVSSCAAGTRDSDNSGDGRRCCDNDGEHKTTAAPGCLVDLVMIVKNEAATIARTLESVSVAPGQCGGWRHIGL